MHLNDDERAVLDFLEQKCLALGQVQAGYLFRRRAVEAAAAAQGGGWQTGLSGLADKGLIAPLERGDRFYLTAAGASALGAPPPSAEA